jgi:antitoxin component YwqK of YwqJK toxin-antitoxin module
MSYFDQIKSKIIKSLTDIFNKNSNGFISIIMEYCQHSIINEKLIKYESIYNFKHGYETEYWVKSNDINRIKLKRFYLKGKLEGESIKFYEDGKIEHLIYYKNGLRHGICQYYDHTGEDYTLVKYENGNFICVVDKN